jgi:nucleotide-binding universal stress UspA family protein
MSPTARIKRIVVGIDFSEGSDAALKRAFELAAVFDAVVDVVHVLQPEVIFAPAGLGVVALPDAPEFYRKLEAALDERARKAAPHKIVCETNSLTGFPPHELVEHARKTGADLIVVGTHGRTGVQHAVLGSVAERVVQRSFCPVLVVPQPR